MSRTEIFCGPLMPLPGYEDLLPALLNRGVGVVPTPAPPAPPPVVEPPPPTPIPAPPVSEQAADLVNLLAIHHNSVRGAGYAEARREVIESHPELAEPLRSGEGGPLENRGSRPSVFLGEALRGRVDRAERRARERYLANDARGVQLEYGNRKLNRDFRSAVESALPAAGNFDRAWARMREQHPLLFSAFVLAFGEAVNPSTERGEGEDAAGDHTSPPALRHQGEAVLQFLSNRALGRRREAFASAYGRVAARSPWILKLANGEPVPFRNRATADLFSPEDRLKLDEADAKARDTWKRDLVERLFPYFRGGSSISSWFQAEMRKLLPPKNHTEQDVDRAFDKIQAEFPGLWAAYVATHAGHGYYRCM